MQTTSQLWIRPNPTITPHWVSQSTGWTYAIKDPDSVSTNYSKPASQSASEPVKLLNVCSWSMTVFPHTNYSETVVQLCGGLALSHTISNTIDWQRGHEDSGWERATVMISEGGSLRMKKMLKTPQLFLSFCWCNDACSHIEASVCLLRVCLFSYACVCAPKKSTEETCIKSDRPPSFPLFISLSAVSSDPANYCSLTVR